MPNRRRFLQTIPAVPALGTVGASEAFAAPAARDYFKELGVRTFINAAGTYTTLTASLMTPEVLAAWNYASKSFVRLNELHDAVAKRLAELLQCEAVMITSGAAGALVVGTAACITGDDPEKIRRIPDTTGMKNEVIVQKSHRYGYDHAVRACGIRFIEVETAEELERAINPRTAMMLFFNDADPRGQIHAEEFVQLGKKHGIPTFNDAAADVPPVENLTKYTKMGFDLVTFSGGKNMRGPQSAGLLMGRKDLIDAARLNTSPYSDTIGRGLKVNKEEILAMYVAVESYLKRDHAADWREAERRVKYIADSLRSFKTVTTEIKVPEIANHVPHLHIKWDQSKITVAEVVKKLRDGDPSIEVGPGSREELIINTWVAQPGDAEIIAKRLREILKPYLG
ncbi:MAG: aminotransferase class V-fold PLP-dependent enzyme [Bryobacteraceae bacterium]|nr:aminotransferase class V-fold PLP-dependent enzyme [Bryobacteraceae bacterium]MDW8379796.1 aminotransferase class V-fold PLP-dependent enzyme [Bryobacterales bacterium]